MSRRAASTLLSVTVHYVVSDVGHDGWAYRARFADGRIKRGLLQARTKDDDEALEALRCVVAALGGAWQDYAWRYREHQGGYVWERGPGAPAREPKPWERRLVSAIVDRHGLSPEQGAAALRAVVVAPDGEPIYNIALAAAAAIGGGQ